MTEIIFIRNGTILTPLLPKASNISGVNEDLKNVFNASLGPFKVYVFLKFQKFHSPNQLKYLMVNFSKVISHIKGTL
jgi:hypothetical protein